MLPAAAFVGIFVFHVTRVTLGGSGQPLAFEGSRLLLCAALRAPLCLEALPREGWVTLIRLAGLLSWRHLLCYS